ncbi:hypothetical protein GX48_00381 [Paracoccidioides brasiliensis]|nr:hypothetical protein GX48_00381 [Paracoccidioides brasiliensis]
MLTMNNNAPLKFTSSSILLVKPAKIDLLYIQTDSPSNLRTAELKDSDLMILLSRAASISIPCAGFWALNG